MKIDFVDFPARFLKEQKRALEKWSRRQKKSQAEILRDLVSAEMKREARRG
jgi:hypothetical protein